MNNEHYYFNNKRGSNEIKRYPFEVNTAYYPNFEELTDEQVSFYKQNPTATVQEVRACKITEKPQYQPLTVDVATLKEQTISEASKLSLETIGRHVSDYQFANAQSTLLATNGVEIYDKEKAQQTINEYATVGKQCRDAFYALKTAVEAAATEEEITAAYESYKNILNAI